MYWAGLRFWKVVMSKSKWGIDVIETKPNVWIIERPPVRVSQSSYCYEERKAGTPTSPTTDWGEILSSVLAAP